MQTYGVEVVRDFHNHKKPMFSDDNQFPEWAFIFFNKITEQEYKCNICEAAIETDEKNLELLAHIENYHKDLYALHKNNSDATVGFQIEFLNLNMLKDDSKSETLILEDVCERVTDEISDAVTVTKKENEESVGMQYVLIPRKKKGGCPPENRRRSWVWKYFNKLSNIIYRCNLCNVVLSIKGCNTNNMNRHVRTRHPTVYKSEIEKKKDSDSVDLTNDIGIEASCNIKTEEINAIDKEFDETFETLSQKQRRSWIWSYFIRISSTLAQCKLCNRNISHGGNATGNMNRHLKMIHNKTGDDNGWVWKVFESAEDDFYSCKICQFKCMKFEDVEQSIQCILEHLKSEHGVISGDQIITGTEFEGEEIQ